MSHRDPVDVLHGVLLQLDGGISAAAKRIGRSPGILHNKFSDAMPHYEVTAREAIALPAGRAGDDDVLESYLAIIQQMGELSKEFTEARADGVIDPEEFQALKFRAHRTVAAIMHMLNEVETTVRDLPSPPPVCG